jgi:hypothetical protein
MDELNTGSVAPEAAGKLSDVSAAPAIATPDATTESTNAINPSVAALQQPLGNINKDAWYNGLKPELKGFAELKNWKDVDSAVESYQHLEKLLGADKAGRGIVLPADEADTDGWNQVFNKLGRPASPDDYKLNVPEGLDGSMSKETAKWMHEAGLSAKQAQMINDKYNAHVLENIQAQEAKYQQQSESEINSLFNEWGKEKDRNIELARRGTAAAGLKPEVIAQLEKTIGAKQTYEMFKNIGASYLEDSFESNSSAKNPMGMSPEAARVRLDQLKKLPEYKDFRDKLLAKDPTARKEWDSLNFVAYNGG